MPGFLQHVAAPYELHHEKVEHCLCGLQRVHGYQSHHDTAARTAYLGICTAYLCTGLQLPQLLQQWQQQAASSNISS